MTNIRYVDGWMHSRFFRFLRGRNGRIDGREDWLSLVGSLFFAGDSDFFFGHVEIVDVRGDGLGDKELALAATESASTERMEDAGDV